jgi:hypothetical protein
MTNQTQVFDTPETIKSFQLAAISKAIELEMKGLRRSKGPSASAIARKMGFTGNKKEQVRKIREHLGLPALP